MNTVSRMITGIAMIVIGLFLIALPLLFSMDEGFWVSWIYGVPIFIMGIFILFNTKEDKIEGRKDMKGGKK